MKYNIDKLAIASHLGIRTSEILSISTWAYVFYVRVRGLGCRFISKSVLQKYKETTRGLYPTSVFLSVDKNNYDNVTQHTSSKTSLLGINHIILLLKSKTKEEVKSHYKSLALLVNRLDFDSNVASFAAQHKGWGISSDKLQLLCAVRVAYNRLFTSDRGLLHTALSLIDIDMFELYDIYTEIG